MTYSSKEKRNAATKIYREKNAEKIREYARSWYADNREKYLADQKARLEANPENRKAYEKKWYAENKERYLSLCKEYRVSNKQIVLEKARAKYAADPTKCLAQSRKREVSKIMRTPPWYGEFDQLVFEEAFSLAALREKATGIEWHVDHMLPLRGRVVSGLHVGLNAQVIPAALNLSKCNKMLHTNPGEWVKAI